ncbi:hypothetical protein, partial [Vibrio aestuarianus]|uniref:hypothetical protein n=1 Tax=Vibrio aestuarianus TaxID=28171 RepID=UPI00237C95BD
FKNPFRPSQLAENTERILNEIVALTSKTHQTHNAALRCEQRLATLERSENAKRCESLLNALLTALFRNN